MLVLGVLAGLLAGCDKPAPAPSPAGGGVRIASLSPAASILLRDLGEQDRIVGRHAYDLILDPAKVPSCGDQAGIDYESLLRVRPSIVITQWGSRELPERLVSLARGHAWTLHECTLLTLADIEREAVEVGALVGGKEGRARGERLREKLEHAWSPRDGGFTSVGRVLLLVSTEPADALGPGSCHYEILTRIGGMPALTEGKPFVRLDAEDVLRLRPDAIVLIAPRAPGATPGTGTPALDALAKLDIPAVRNGRVGVIDDPLGLIPSSNMGDFADELAALLSSWRPGTGGYHRGP